jgi:GNAT superfamily N-acetyltransferase
VESPYRLTVEAEPQLVDVAELEERVAAAASAAAGIDGERELAVFVRDLQGGLLAGVYGLTWGGCCDLQAMWVDESLRGQGVARQLMAAAEEEARGRGCRLVTFMAYDLLTSGLYEHLGYTSVADVPDGPGGGTARWFVKRL